MDLTAERPLLKVPASPNDDIPVSYENMFTSDRGGNFFGSEYRGTGTNRRVSRLSR